MAKTTTYPVQFPHPPTNLYLLQIIAHLILVIHIIFIEVKISSSIVIFIIYDQEIKYILDGEGVINGVKQAKKTTTIDKRK